MSDRLKIPKNTLGRDFVCGDLHGSYDRLIKFMEFVDFDPLKDRMFSVGDLVDRGPDNEKCLLLLLQPWFFAVRGNHEMLMHDWYFNGPTGAYWQRNGGGWGINYDNPNDPESHNEIARTIIGLAQKAGELPVMLTVERQDGKFFHVIHAELAPGAPITDADLDDEKTFHDRCFRTVNGHEHVLWGRYMFYGSAFRKLEHNELLADDIAGQLLEAGVLRMFTPELSHIYCGHTIQGQPTRIGGQTNLDTCAFGSYPNGTTGGEPPRENGLTVTEPLTDRFWLSNFYGVEETSPYVLI